MKKTIAKSMTAIMAAAMIAGSLTACGGSDNKAETTAAVETTAETTELLRRPLLRLLTLRSLPRPLTQRSPLRPLTLRSLPRPLTQKSPARLMRLRLPKKMLPARLMLRPQRKQLRLLRTNLLSRQKGCCPLRQHPFFIPDV